MRLQGRTRHSTPLSRGTSGWSQAGWRLVLALLLALVLSACRSSSGQSHLALAQPEDLQPLSLGEGQRLRVVATTSIVADVAANVGGDYIELTVLIPRGTDPHAYQPTSGDLQALYQADLVLLNGFELEASLEDELGSLNASVPLLSLSEGLPARTLDAQGDHGDDNNDHDEGLDPHVWFDPTYVMHWVDRIETALVRLDPDQTTGFQANADRFRDELAALDAWIVEQVASIPLNRRKLVLDHLVLGYFAERYDFEVISALVSAFSSAAEASPRELATLTELIRAEKVPAIFIGVDTNPRLAEQLAGDLGIAVVPLYTGSLSAVGGPAETYLEMMQYNVLVIQNALSSE
jgi:ABC-type Zn uptake system ZnuABC Zn-binding protein ZnuA